MSAVVGISVIRWCLSVFLMRICDQTQPKPKKYLEEHCLSVEGGPPANMYSVILVWPWSWSRDLGNWVETRQNCLVLSVVVFTPPIRTREDKTVLSCLCRQCEQAIKHRCANRCWEVPHFGCKLTEVNNIVYARVFTTLEWSVVIRSACHTFFSHTSQALQWTPQGRRGRAVSYTHLRAQRPY